MSDKLHLFKDVHMGLGHEGLVLYAKKHKFDLVKHLDRGGGAFFISRDRRKAKYFAKNKVLCYLRSADISRPLDVEALNYFPQAFFEDGKFNYAKALEQKIIKHFERKGRKIQATIQVVKALQPFSSKSV